MSLFLNGCNKLLSLRSTKKGADRKKIKVNNLEKSYRKKKVVDNLSFATKETELFFLKMY